MNNYKQLSQLKFFKIVEKKGWLEISLENGRYNYISIDVITEMMGILIFANQNKDLNCVLLKSACDGIFSRGMEIRQFQDISHPKKMNVIMQSAELLTNISKSEIPFICVIQGECFGAALELILSCDIRLASKGSKFSASEVIFGLMPSGGGIQRLLRLIGKGQASRILLTGMTIDAIEATRIGVIDECVDDDKVYQRGEQIAKRLSRIPRMGLAGIKTAISYGIDHSLQDSINRDIQGLNGILQEQRLNNDRH